MHSKWYIKCQYMAYIRYFIYTTLKMDLATPKTTYSILLLILQGSVLCVFSFIFEPGGDAYFCALLSLHRLKHVFHMQLLVCQQTQLLGGTKDHPITENNPEYLFMSPSPTLEIFFNNYNSKGLFHLQEIFTPLLLFFFSFPTHPKKSLP